MTCCPTTAYSPRIVLAEDDLDFRELLAAKLRLEGWRVVEVEDGDHLAEFVGTALFTGVRMPHAIVSDVRMPGRSGLDVAAALHRACAIIPIVLMSAFGDEETHRQAVRLGAVAVLDKPFEFRQLLGLLTRYGRTPTRQ